MTTATPGLMPKRRNAPTKLTSNVRVPQHGRNQPQRPFSGLTATIGSMNPAINCRLACNKVTDWIESQKWTRETIADISALVELWFELAESGSLNVPLDSDEVTQTRRVFVEACFDASIRSLVVQKEAWYTDLAVKVKTERQDAKTVRSAGVSTRPKQSAQTDSTTSANTTFCGNVAGKVAENPSITALEGNAAVLVRKMIKIYPTLKGSAKERRKAAFDKALAQLKWGFRRQHDSIQSGYAVFCTAVNAAIRELRAS